MKNLENPDFLVDTGKIVVSSSAKFWRTKLRHILAEATSGSDPDEIWSIDAESCTE